MRHPYFISIAAVTLGKMLDLYTAQLPSSGTEGVRDHVAFRGKTASVFESFIKGLWTYFFVWSFINAKAFYKSRFTHTKYLSYNFFKVELGLNRDDRTNFFLQLILPAAPTSQQRMRDFKLLLRRMGTGKRLWRGHKSNVLASTK